MKDYTTVFAEKAKAYRQRAKNLLEATTTATSRELRETAIELAAEWTALADRLEAEEQAIFTMSVVLNNDVPRREYDRPVSR
jgi:hypothetical protein